MLQNQVDDGSLKSIPATHSLCWLFALWGLCCLITGLTFTSLAVASCLWSSGVNFYYISSRRWFLPICVEGLQKDLKIKKKKSTCLCKHNLWSWFSMSQVGGSKEALWTSLIPESSESLLCRRSSWCFYGQWKVDILMLSGSSWFLMQPARHS